MTLADSCRDDSESGKPDLATALKAGELADLAKLATIVAQMPVALVCLASESEAEIVVHSTFGWQPKAGPIKESTSSNSLLGSPEFLVLQDASRVKNFADHPLVMGEPEIRAIVRIPIFDSDSAEYLGSLCVADPIARSPDEDVIDGLRAIAKQIGKAISQQAIIADLYKKANSLSRQRIISRGLLDSSRNFIGLMSPDGIVLDANRTALAAAGISSDAVIGKPFWETPWWQHSPQLQTRLKEAIRRARGGESDRFEATHPAPDGSLIYVDFSLTPVKNEEGTVVSLIPEGVNITDRRQQEAALQDYAAGLKLANEDLDSFAYVASHDLRSPLRSISVLVRWIMDDEAERLSSASQEHLKLLDQRIERLVKMLDDLLVYTRAGAKTGRPSPVCTKTLVGEVVEMIRSPHGFDIRIAEDLPECTTFVAPLRQVFLNLIDNAIKHHDQPSGTIQIQAQKIGRMIEFRVTDDGPGIDPKYREHVFGLFQRLRPKNGDSGGSGVGLAVIRKTVRRFGGEIEVVPSDDRGTTFRFTWPEQIG